MAKKPTRPKDANQLAKAAVAIATGENQNADLSVDLLKAAAAALGRKAAKRGACWPKLFSASRRSEIAKKARRKMEKVAPTIETEPPLVLFYKYLVKS